MRGKHIPVVGLGGASRRTRRPARELQQQQADVQPAPGVSRPVILRRRAADDPDAGPPPPKVPTVAGGVHQVDFMMRGNVSGPVNTVYEDETFRVQVQRIRNETNDRFGAQGVLDAVANYIISTFYTSRLRFLFHTLQAASL